MIDGVLLGHPVYNNFRQDIASLFPGYTNSQGAVGFFYVNTTTMANGVHTISWNVFDNQGRGEGIGSRYWNVFNTGGPIAAPEEEALQPATADITRPIEIEEVGRVELPLGAIRGYQLANGERAELPIGSSLKGGVFYWNPGTADDRSDRGSDSVFCRSLLDVRAAGQAGKCRRHSQTWAN